ncbi:MAG: hypothetical protein M4579_000979 [Chaenotheca gracillima]|nr:MAG: hypothetical protein M4579_000979 [Chaenotheca gracillima]
MTSADGSHELSMANHHYALVTGANSGLGFAICCRLIDEAHPTYQSLTIIFTTRSSRKGADTLARLQKYYNQNASKSKFDVHFQPELLELTRLESVKRLSERLLQETPKLDSLFLNAGTGAFVGINWFRAIWSSLTEFMECVTWPTYNKSFVGSVTDLQLSRRTEGGAKGAIEPPLGEVFCANVLGHYMLGHLLIPLLNAPTDPGRIIWISSLEALGDSFNPLDPQFLTSSEPYRASKRLTDLLALTAHLPSSRPWTDRYLTPPQSSVKDKRPPSDRPRIYLAHPGICSTEIMALNIFINFAKLIAFYVARLLGSPWHTINPYIAAVSPVWLALSPQSRLDDLETEFGPAKWGSATDWSGEARVIQTQVDGWGYGGIVGGDDLGRKGRRKGAVVLSKQSREEFLEIGRECWRQMETVRGEWENHLDIR